jgi:hypothetical protein
MTTIDYAMPYIVNYRASLTSGTNDYGHAGTVADELSVISLATPDLDLKEAVRQVLGNSNTECEYSNRVAGSKCIWSYLHSVKVVDEDNSWISKEPIPSLEPSQTYDKGLVATTVQGLIDVINGLEDFSKWAAIVYGFGYGQNSEAYNSYATAKGIDLGGRVVKVDPEVIRLLEAEGTGNYHQLVTKDINSRCGIRARDQAKLKKLTGFGPCSFRLTCLYLLRKSGLEWNEINEQLNKEISSGAQQEVNDLLK